MLSPSDDCRPFLKWAGGKRWFVARYLDILPTRFDRYIEPFLGSGALFFALNPTKAILSDLNVDLIQTYLAIQKDWKRVVEVLANYQRAHSSEFYYTVRSSQPRSLHGRAARLIYLNRTCWNGLYRVNVRGQFNVPMGTKQSVVLDSDDFYRTSMWLKRASLLACDFESVISRARRGDLVFADPPYVTAHSQNGFLKYNEKLFSWDDQVRLMECLLKAKRRGARIVATNADTPSVRKLYGGWFSIRTVTRSSVIAASSLRRGTTSELVITGW
jgi:DNA adenine methylase